MLLLRVDGVVGRGIVGQGVVGRRSRVVGQV